jgi:ribokinase
LVGNIIFIGHVSMDWVKNVNGVRIQPGGAALYAAIAARTLLKDVRAVSVIGRDYKFMNVLKLFDSEHVKVFNMPSTRFHIQYNEQWEASYLKVNYGAGARITASTIPVKEFGADDIVHLSPMRSTKVEKIVNKIREESPDTAISINTWINYIKEGRKARNILKKLALKTDFFILNDSEAKALTQTDSLSSALRLLKAKMLIVTLGELGAIISGDNSEIQMVPALNVPIGRVVDTTGAGDTWCGAFLAAYKLTSNIMKSITTASIISSIMCSDWSFNSLKNLEFRKPEDVIEYVIALKEGGLQKRISDYTKSASK